MLHERRHRSLDLVFTISGQWHQMQTWKHGTDDSCELIPPGAKAVRMNRYSKSVAVRYEPVSVGGDLKCADCTCPTIPNGWATSIKLCGEHM